MQIAGNSEGDCWQKSVQLIWLYNPKWGTLYFGIARFVASASGDNKQKEAIILKATECDWLVNKYASLLESC